MQQRINTPNARSKLAERAEPYWHQIRRGGYVGYRQRKLGGSWIARWRNEEGLQKYKKLDGLDSLSEDRQFDAACQEAAEWFESMARPGAPGTRCTVEQACDHYLTTLGAEKGPRAVRDARMRINAYIKPKLGGDYLDELTTARLNAWRNGFVPKEGDEEALRKARDTANRHLNSLKAILNRAWQDGLAADDSAWRKVKRFKQTGEARKVLLSDAQIGRLLKHTSGGFHQLVRGLLLTGMRPGIEIEHILREQLHDDGTLEIRQSKTGPRVVYLSSEARAFFKELAKGKTPKAPLFSRDDGTKWPEKEAARMLGDIKSKAKLPADTVLYSLRHTYISRALEHGASVKLIADNCGTSIRMLEKHYWKAINRRRQEMLDGVQMLPVGSAT